VQNRIWHKLRTIGGTTRREELWKQQDPFYAVWEEQRQLNLPFQSLRERRRILAETPLAGEGRSDEEEGDES
jgi:hypothetical protein